MKFAVRVRFTPTGRRLFDGGPIATAYLDLHGHAQTFPYLFDTEAEARTAAGRWQHRELIELPDDDKVGA